MKFKNLLLLGLTITMAVSCSSGAKTEAKEGGATEEAAAETNPIVKPWVLENIDATAAMEGMPKETQDQMKAMMDKMVADQKGKMTFDIQEGGKVVVNSPDFEGKWKKSEGTWTLSEDQKALTVDIDSKKEDFIVQELTPDKLNIEMKGEKMNMIFVPKK